MPFSIKILNGCNLYYNFESPEYLKVVTWNVDILAESVPFIPLSPIRRVFFECGRDMRPVQNVRCKGRSLEYP